MANAPTYTNEAGQTEGAAGVIIVNPDGSFSSGSGGGGDASAANQTALNALIGEVQASPTANTVLDRLKALAAKFLAPSAASATLSTVASAASSGQMLASNTSRLGVIVENTDANDAYIKYGTTASLTSFTARCLAGGYWEMPRPIYTGRIDIIWAADGSGSAYVTEL